ncbi:MAG: TonB-dependent receptor, partial [Bacteroidota bacterium]
NPIPQANILILDSPKGAYTDLNGNYTLEGLSPKTYFFQVSYLGYQTITQSVQIPFEGSLDFQLLQASDQLGEVVVTANRRLQDIQKTAASVSAIGAKQVKQLQVKNFNELSSIAPNFRSYDDGSVGSFTLFSSRGITTLDTNPAVALYIDDVPYFSTFAFPMALGDVDQIEILRGPQGTLYGRNALAGVIKITSKQPTNDVNGYASVGVGNLGLSEYNFAFNMPVVKDKLFFRANADISEREGFVENLFNSEDLQDRKALNANFRLKYLASENLTLGLNYNLQRTESNSYAFALATPDNTFQDILRNAPYQVNFNEDVFRKVFTQNLALNLKYRFNGVSLTAITAYQKVKQSRLDEFDYSPLNIQAAAADFGLDNISQEIRLASSGETNFQWTTGVFGYRIEDNTENTNISGPDAFDPINMVPIPPNTRFDETQLKRKGLAVFGQASYALTDQWKLSGGIRYDYEEASASVTQTSSLPGVPVNAFEADANFKAFSPKVSLSFQASEDVFLFTNVARGFRPGGVNTFVVNQDDAPFDPESTYNYEVGFKSNWLDNRLKLNLTGFYISYTDQQVFTILDPANLVLGTENLGKSRSFGLELETQWVATRGLTFNSNVGWLNTEILDYTTQGVNFFTFEIIENDESGNDLAIAPEFTGNFNVNYVQPITDKLNLESSVDYNYQSQMFLDYSEATFQEGYGLLNARLGVTSKHFDFFVWGKNLTDEVYFSYGFGIAGFTGASFGLPQTYGATLTAKF